MPVAVLCFLGTACFYLLFQRATYRNMNRNLALFFKGTATFFSALLALYGVILQPTSGHSLLLIGLVICTIADVVLGKNLMKGMGIFALGHVYYCGAYFFTARPTLLSLFIFLLLVLLACFFIYPQIKRRSGNKPALPFLGYGIMLFLMLALAVNQKPVLLIGAILFVVSDLLLAFRIFTQNQSKPLDYLCLGCYYLAQYLIALSTLL
ncbi:MAG: lysoplasmalogenase [Clostridiales bacterium]|nr:lysoplasmalogenase [Clostridiales bacterium]